jgi:hypothetical protein
MHPQMTRITQIGNASADDADFADDMVHKEIREIRE